MNVSQQNLLLLLLSLFGTLTLQCQHVMQVLDIILQVHGIERVRAVRFVKPLCLHVKVIRLTQHRNVGFLIVQLIGMQMKGQSQIEDAKRHHRGQGCTVEQR